MYLKSIEAQNYRLLKNVRLNVDKSATLIVGSNNLGKTSLIDLMEKAITKEKLSFDDYPFCRREKFYQGIWDLLLKKISYEDWKQNIDLVSICFVVDYSEESDEDQLGTLTPFIIDLDDNISDAKIEVIYSLSTTEERLRTWVHEEGITLSAMSDSDDLSQENKESIRKLIKKRFRDIFEWKVRAVNPNDPEDVSIRSHKELEDLFPRLVIAAERDIDESDGKKRKPLTDILNRLLETNDDDDDDISEGKKQLRDLLETNGQHVESRANEILEQIMKKAEVLIEALPYIQKYHDKIVVIKYGGNAMTSEELKNAVMSDIVLLSLVGIKAVLIHGGGPEINQMLQKVGIESKFVNGLRYTDKETAEIVRMVLAGKVNKELVALLEQHNGTALGLCGSDGKMLKVRKMKGDDDLGYVGEITDVDVKPIMDALNNGYIPVVATVATDSEGQVYNINADTAASRIASALGAENLILMTDIRGLLRDKDDETSLIPEVNVRDDTWTQSCR